MTLRDFLALPTSFEKISGDDFAEGIKVCEFKIGNFTIIIEFFSRPLLMFAYPSFTSISSYIDYLNSTQTDGTQFFWENDKSSYSFSFVIGSFFHQGRHFSLTASGSINSVNGSISSSSDLVFGTSDIYHPLTISEIEQLGYLDFVHVEIFDGPFVFAPTCTFDASVSMLVIRYDSYKIRYPLPMHIVNKGPSGSSDWGLNPYYEVFNPLGSNLSLCCELDFKNLGDAIG